MKPQSGDLRMHPQFIVQMEQMLAGETDAFFESLHMPSATSIILNPAKRIVNPHEGSEQVPWCPQGRYLNERPEFIFDPYYHAGCYYVMESSSMLLAHIIAQVTPQGNPVFALDLCAAPGGKSITALTALPAGSLLVSNEVIRSRFHILQQNLDRWGAPNVARVCTDPQRLPWDDRFDVVIVDAPCSGEGLFRKDPLAANEWSPAHVELCSARQRRILGEAVRLLAPGGVLIYSTCTYNDSENIEQVVWMKNTFGLNSITIETPESWNMQYVSRDDCNGIQCFPHNVRGEGFFSAVLQKPNDTRGLEHSMRKRKQKSQWSQTPAFLAEWVEGNVRVTATAKGQQYFLETSLEIDWLEWRPWLMPGTEAGESQKNVFVPAHALALSTRLNRNIPGAELNKIQAIEYLRRNTMHVDVKDNGWLTAKYNKMPIGWMKQTQSGLKNYFPVKDRILKQPPALSSED